MHIRFSSLFASKSIEEQGRKLTKVLKHCEDLTKDNWQMANEKHNRYRTYQTYPGQVGLSAHLMSALGASSNLGVWVDVV